MKKDDNYYPVSIRSDYESKYFVYQGNNPVIFTRDKKVMIMNEDDNNSYTYGQTSISKEEIEKMALYTLSIQNQKGNLIQI